MSQTTAHQDHNDQMREKLSRMAGQIAEFFRHLPADEATGEIARHINLYWSRAMRRDLARLFGPDSPELHPLVRNAWGKFRFPVG